MLISTDRPAITWTLPTGGSWLTDADALTNGRPSSVSRLQWLSGAQDTDSVLTLRGSWSAELVPRVLCLLGLTVPVGTLVTLAFMRPADSGYTYLEDEPSQRVVQLPDGSRCAWFVLDEDLDAVIGVEFRIHNDVDGDAVISADSTLDIGEAWIGGAVEVLHEKGWKNFQTDPSITRRSLGSQLFTSERRAYRSLQMTFVASPLPQVRGGALANGQDWETLRAQLRAAARCAVVPRFDTVAEIHRTALFGAATTADITHLTGPLYSGGLGVDEVPALPAP